MVFVCILYTVLLFPVRKITPPVAIPTSGMPTHYSSHTTTHIVHPSHIHEQAAVGNSEVTIVKNVQNQQPVIEQQQYNQQYTHMQQQNPQQHYVPNLMQNNHHLDSPRPQHLINQSHIYVNAPPNPVGVLQQRHPIHSQWAGEIPPHNVTGQHSHLMTSPHQDQMSHPPPSQLHPGSAGHVPYSPALGPSNNYQNVEVIRQVQYQQQQQTHHHQNMQPNRLPPSSVSGDRNVQIVGRSKPVGTVAPNTHTTQSNVQHRVIGRVSFQNEKIMQLLLC